MSVSKLPQSYFNSSYNADNVNRYNTNDTTQRINEKKDLQELHNRFNLYVNTVRQLTEHRIYGYHNDTTFNLINSMKYLEHDIDVLKNLYENELKILRLQIDELSSEKNKYKHDCYNLDIKLRELNQKYNDEKELNEKSLNELNEIKTINNKLEYDLENIRLEYEKPVREYNQLKKEFDSLTSAFNELQEKYNFESRTRENLETKLSELNDETIFIKKINDQEIDNLKSQLQIARNTINDLDTKLKDSENVDNNIKNLLNEVKDKTDNELSRYKAEAEEKYQKNLNYVNEQLKESRLSNEKSKFEIIKLEQRNDTLQTICRNLETTVNTLESTKKSLENELYEQKTKALKNLNEIEEKLNDFQQLYIQSLETKPPPISINLEIESLKELLNEEELRIKKLTTSNNINYNNTTTTNNHNNNNKIMNFNENLNESTGFILNSRNEESIEKKQEYKNDSKYLLNNIQSTQSPIGPISLSGRRAHSAKSSSSLHQDINNNKDNQFLLNTTSIDLIDRQQQNQLLQSQPTSQASTRLHASSANVLSKRASPSNSYPQQNQQQQQHQQKINPLNNIQSTAVKDYTSEMFSSFQKSSLKNKQNNILYNSVENGVTEASYTGNIKIHEVNKNGYYIRILNVSNNCDEDLSSYTLTQMVSSIPIATYCFPNNLQIPAGQTITVWSRTDEVEHSPPHTFVFKEQDKWGTGPECTTILAKPNGQAVSWTTGCHKFGNVDYDEIASVYSRSQRASRSASQLNREKTTPHIIYKYNPIKHPHTNSTCSKVHPSSAFTSNDLDKTNVKIHRQRSINSATVSRKPVLTNFVANFNLSPLSAPYFKSD